MTIEIGQGSILDSGASTLVCPVNCVGTLGKGLALAFKRQFPFLHDSYVEACRSGALTPGRVVSWGFGRMPRHVICFPTKMHWRDPSKLEYIESGLLSLLFEVGRLRVSAVSIPALGCGLGGLSWDDVRPRIERVMAAAHDVRVILYEPQETE